MSIKTSACSDDEDDTGSAEVKKLDEDKDLQANVDEEAEGKIIAEDTVRAMTEEMSSDSDADKETEEDDGDTSKSVSVLPQVGWLQIAISCVRRRRETGYRCRNVFRDRAVSRRCGC